MNEHIEIPSYIRALIFDCDGTLVDSMPLHMKAWQSAFAEFNIPLKDNFLFSLKGMKEVEIVKTYNQKMGTALDPEAVAMSKRRHFLQDIHAVKPIKKITDIASAYFGKIPLAVVSGSLRNIVHKELKIIGIFNLFEVILTGDDPFKPKPDPDIFLAAARYLDVRAEQCQVFEDGDPGLEAAEKAGMKTTDVRLYI